VSTVYVIENGKVRQQQVTLGERQGKLVEVVSGLNGSETVAVSNLSQLATGTDVRIGPAHADENGGGKGGRR
jgi:multidrug efflux pump subunit AcrA (membrane-fusion protein)